MSAIGRFEPINFSRVGQTSRLCPTFTGIKMTGNEKLLPGGTHQWQIRLIFQDAGLFQVSDG